MQLPQDFWAFSFELNNSHLFQQNLMPALHDYTTMTSLWRNVSVNAVANSNWSCSLTSAPKVHWRVQSSAARRSSRFNKLCGRPPQYAPAPCKLPLGGRPAVTSLRDRQTSDVRHASSSLNAHTLGAGHNNMHGARRALHVSLNSASRRTVHKCFRRNNGHPITPNLNGMGILCLGSDARSYCETFTRSLKQFRN